MTDQTSLDSFMNYVSAKNPGQHDFLQAVHEVAEYVLPFVEKNKIIKNIKFLNV